VVIPVALTPLLAALALVVKAGAGPVIKVAAAVALEDTQGMGEPQIALLPGTLGPVVVAVAAGHLPVLDVLEPVVVAAVSVCLGKAQTALAGRQVPVTPAVVVGALLVVQEMAAHHLTAALAGRSGVAAAGKIVLAGVTEMAAQVSGALSASYGPVIPAASRQHVWALNL